VTSHRKRFVAPFLVAASVGASIAAAAFAAPGDLDTTFSGDGKVTTKLSSADDHAKGVAIQADGKIVAAGHSSIRGNGTFGLARYNSDGTLDPTFSWNGKVKTDFTAGNDYAQGVAIQANGKIVLAGGANERTPFTFARRFALARYNPNGSLDRTFGGDGKVTTDFSPDRDVANAVAIQADGKIVAAGVDGYGSSKFALARYNRNGTLDSTFSGDGKVRTNFTAEPDFALDVAIQADGKIVAAGGAGTGSEDVDFALARYNSNGSLDRTFGGDGKVTTDFPAPSPDDEDIAHAVAIQPDGKIVALGLAHRAGPFALARYNPDGSLDPTFGGDGQVMAAHGAASDVAIQADGRIVTAGGGNGAFALARYNPDGSLDTTFGDEGNVTTDFTAGGDGASGVAIQSNGRIVAAGGTGRKFALARYLAE
jgi:uncharacterized delta-60 repeat protein